jgi:hypothetical protein
MVRRSRILGSAFPLAAYIVRLLKMTLRYQDRRRSPCADKRGDAMTHPMRLCVFLFLAAFSLAVPVTAAPAAEPVKDAKASKEDKPKTIAELVKDSARVDGLFTLFQDKKTGQVRMLVKPDQLGKEFIYFAQASNGVPEAGFIFRGAYLAETVVTVQRHFDRLEFVAENTSFYFDPDSALARARDANQIPSLLAVEKIVAEDEKTGEMLIEADKLFLSQSLLQVKPSPDPDADPKKTYSLGTLSDAKSKILGLRSYPLNTDVEVEYVFEDPAPRYDLLQDAREIKDPRNVAIRVLHSFIAVPADDYTPRFYDPRVGFFSQRVTDLTSDSATPYRDVIDRWKLVKKDPTAALSEPVEPIVWWIENTTPVEWRDTIRDAALAWNSAFEKAGFRNAIVVKVQPDDADWDAGDIRYNVLRWTSSPAPLFGGYGPSVANPRTGQILGADVMLEYSYLINYVDWSRAIGSGKAAGRDDLCMVGDGLRQGLMLGRTMARALNLDSAREEQMFRETMFELVLHELGHTLGLQHNFKATQMASPEQLADAAYVAAHGTIGSVMDYPDINFAPLGKAQTQFFETAPGPYDGWAIEYGYSQGLDDAAAEEVRLQAILARASEPGLAFGNDSDDMRTPGSGIDPRVNIFDQSNDPVRYQVDRVALLRASLAGLEERFVKPGESRQELYNAFRRIMRAWRNAASIMAIPVGGVYVDRDWSQEGAGKASYTPVALAAQRAAMQALARDVFAPDAFSIPPQLYAELQPQPRGQDFYGKTEDPKIHDLVLATQQAALNQLLHPVVLKRITDTRLYGNEYPLASVMADLTDAVFQADLSGDVNTFRQNLQVDYVDRLAGMVQGDGKARFDAPTQSMAIYELKRLRKALGKKRGGNVETQAHTQHLLLTIDRALDVKA